MIQARVLGIVLARGGSKRLPNKNVKLLAGKPLIAYTIEAALNSRLLDRVIVSTDNLRIRDTARQFGAEVPFLRPGELATDDITVYPAITHAIQWLQEREDYRPDYVMGLQATSPLRTAGDIDNSIELAREKDAASVISLCQPKTHPYWMMQVSEGGTVTDFIPWDRNYSRHQDLPSVYARNGAIFLTRCQHLLDHQTFTTPPVYPYVMPPERSADIDTQWDFDVAEAILQVRKFKSKKVQ